MSSYNIAVEKYSENSIVVRGPDTIKFKDTLKEFGGVWNSNLKGGGGWIFYTTAYDKVAAFLGILGIKTVSYDTLFLQSKVEFEMEKKEIPIVDNYTEICFILTGNTKPYKDKIKELGGSWNPKLKDGKMGWVFPEKKREEVQNWLKGL
jgi:hypothetical protein